MFLSSAMAIALCAESEKSTSNLHQFEFPRHTVSFLSYFFAKKMPLSRRVEFVLGLWMSQSVSQSVRDVCISHQSDWIY